MQKWQAGQATGSRHHRQSLQKSRAKKPPEMGGGILQGAAPAERWTIGGNMGGGHAGNAAALAESPRRGVLCARYQAYTRAIYGPPMVHPQSHARAARHSCKIAQQEPPAQQAGTTAARADQRHRGNSGGRRLHSRSRQPAQHHRSDRKPARQQAGTATGQPDRRADHGDRPDDDRRTGTEGRRYSQRWL